MAASSAARVSGGATGFGLEQAATKLITTSVASETKNDLERGIHFLPKLTSAPKMPCNFHRVKFGGATQLSILVPAPVFICVHLWLAFSAGSFCPFAELC